MNTAKNVEIAGYRILGDQPTVGDLLKFVGTYTPRYAVFEDTPIYHVEADLSDDDFDLIECNSKRIGDFGVIWNSNLIDMFIDKVAFCRSLVQFYSTPDMPKLCHLADRNWDCVYFCYDSTWVEFFSRVESISNSIKNRYKTELISYPGNIDSPGGLIIKT
jgi:hypothetical protein